MSEKATVSKHYWAPWQYSAVHWCVLGSCPRASPGGESWFPSWEVGVTFSLCSCIAVVRCVSSHEPTPLLGRRQGDTSPYSYFGVPHVRHFSRHLSLQAIQGSWYQPASFCLLGSGKKGNTALIHRWLPLENALFPLGWKKPLIDYVRNFPPRS